MNCAICEQPCKKVEIVLDNENCVFKVTAWCHGKKDIHRLTPRQLMQRKTILIPFQ